MVAELEEEELLVDRNIKGISVQDLYRPVVKMLRDGKDIPDVPIKNDKDPGYIWWKEQIRRCKYGWVAPDGRYLNGYLYFYLNFVQIPIREEDSDRFNWVFPLYRDNDQIILDQIWENTPRRVNGKYYNGMNHIHAKPRGVAWTMITLFGVAMWTFVFRNDAHIGLAYPKEEYKETERKQFIQAWSTLHPMFKRRRIVKNERSIGIKVEEIIENNDEGFATGYMAGAKNPEIINKVWFNVIGQEGKSGVYKGKRLNLMIAAEAGMWVGDSLKQYFTENEPVINLGGRQWGMMLVGGTSNAVINKSTAYFEMYTTPVAFNATTGFTPKTMVLMGHVDYHTGKSNQETALAQIMAKRDSKKDDPGAYQQELIENPLVWEEAFIPNDTQAVYNTGVINAQISKIKMEGLENLWVRGKIEYILDRYGKPTKQVRFVMDEEGLSKDNMGDWLINIEGMPTPGRFRNLYVAGIDDRYKSRKLDKKVKTGDSSNAMVIWRRRTSYPIKSDIPCAIYFGNKADMLIAYEEFYKGMLLYEIEKSMYENNADTFIMFLRDYKKEIHRLYFHEGEYGLKVSSPEIKAELTYLGTQFLAANREKNITHTMLLQSMLDWGVRNTDVGSALHLAWKIMELMEDSVITQMRPIEEEKESQIVKLGIKRAPAQQETGSVARIKLGPRAA